MSKRTISTIVLTLLVEAVLFFIGLSGYYAKTTTGEYYGWSGVWMALVIIGAIVVAGALLVWALEHMDEE
jgi:uncharacterized membrane protein